ncbi:MAG: RNA polymerase sigma factor [Gammaproteobacteria bacterium]|jgi:RNA polymerase sigma-70 factor (ECF subfamily)|nr:RNA polymerase sigma factor [Gammaproteobacteria bacterium]
MDHFKQLLTDQLPVLMRLALALTGEQSSADDLLQDCVERALRNCEQWDARKKLKPWLFAIMRNLYIDNYRRLDVSKHTIPMEFTDELSSLPSQETHVTTHDVYKALMQLPLEHREVLLLVGLEEMDYKETSQILNIPLGTVMSRLHRARKQLRDQLFAAELQNTAKVD